MGTFTQRIAILGCPSRPDVPWTDQNVQRLADLGFNAVQLNLAWGSRPGDEALNLEDIVDVPADREYRARYRITTPDRSPARIAARAAILRERLTLAKAHGLRTIFHFGAPYLGPYSTSPRPERDVSQPAIVALYTRLVRDLGQVLPGLDDLLMYTYDQQAMMSSEFDVQEGAFGVPLHERAPAFVNAIGQAWHAANPDGRLWWEPWELSAGQVYRCIPQLDPAGVGLMLHSNIAEVQLTNPVDAWLRNTALLAAERGLPVVVEGFLNAPTEEFEPYRHLQCPQVYLREVQRIAAVPGVGGIKEYYGLIPDQPDPNLGAVAEWLRAPSLTEEAVLQRVAAPYGSAADEVTGYWSRCTQAVNLYPWDASWWARGVGNAILHHSVNAAYLHGYCANTPAWHSTRGSVFMKTDERQDHPWMLEDVQLRLELTAARMGEAITLGRNLAPRIPEALREAFTQSVGELENWRLRCLTKAYHLRETNLAGMMRRAPAGGPMLRKLTEELTELMQRDLEIQKPNADLSAALDLLQRDVPAFLERYFKEGTGTGWGYNFTSR